MPKSRLTIRRVRDLLRLGKTVDEISEILGRDTDIVRRLILEANKIYAQSDRDVEICRLLIKGITLQQIANEYGITRQAVHLIRVKFGFKSKRIDNIHLDKIRRLIEIDGLSCIETAGKLRISIDRVLLICELHNIKTR